MMRAASRMVIAASAPSHPASWFSGLALGLALPVFACSSPHRAVAARDVADANDTGALAASSSVADRRTLALIAGAPTHGVQHLVGGKVVVDPPYQSASGRLCRLVHGERAGSNTSRERLACSDGRAWFFVPDVFVGSSGE